MRNVEIRRAWKDAIEKDRGFSLVDFACSNKPPFADVLLGFCNGVTIVCGLNGVGKTTLLRLIEAALATEDPDRPLRSELRDAGEVTVRWSLDGATFDATIEQAAIENGVYLLDSAATCAALANEWRQENFDDLLEGVEGRVLTRDELDDLAFLVGRRYEWVSVTEFEPTSLSRAANGDLVLPFFEAQSVDFAYTSREMGLGELAAMCLWWSLERAEPASFVLVEEPETFLSSRSALAFLNLLARFVHSRRLSAVVTTHSPDVVSRVPKETLRLLIHIPATASVEAVKPSTKAEVEASLGLSTSRARLVYVEDEMAKAFLSELLITSNALWSSTIDILVAGDASSVSLLTRRIPESAAIRVVGVLDGDQRSSWQPSEDDNWPTLFLPTEIAPDSLLREAARDNVEMFADSLGVSLDLMNRALEPVAGDNAHDWFPNLAKILGVDQRSLVRASTRCFLHDANRSGEAADLVEDLAGSLLE